MAKMNWREIIDVPGLSKETLLAAVISPDSIFPPGNISEDSKIALESLQSVLQADGREVEKIELARETAVILFEEDCVIGVYNHPQKNLARWCKGFAPLPDNARLAFIDIGVHSWLYATKAIEDSSGDIHLDIHLKVQLLPDRADKLVTQWLRRKSVLHREDILDSFGIFLTGISSMLSLYRAKDLSRDFSMHEKVKKRLERDLNSFREQGMTLQVSEIEWKFTKNEGRAKSRESFTERIERDRKRVPQVELLSPDTDEPKGSLTERIERNRKQSPALGWQEPPLRHKAKDRDQIVGRESAKKSKAGDPEILKDIQRRKIRQITLEDTDD